MTNWQTKPLGEICEIKSGKNQKNVINPNGKYPIYGSSGIFGFADEYICDENTTIIGRKGTINSPIFVKTKFWNVDTAFGLCAKEDLNSKFLYFFCLGFNFKKLDKSTTIPSLSKGDLLSIQIPLPDLATQQAIVSKIEELFSDLDKGLEDLKKAQQQLKTFRQSVLKWAFEGKLTNENVKEGKLPKGWEVSSLNDLCEMKAGYFVKSDNIKTEKDENLYRCFGGNGLRGYTDSFTHQGKFALVGRQGALCGNVHYVEGIFHATEHAVVVKAKRDIDIKCLYYKLVEMKLNKYASGVAQPGLSVNKILPLQIFFPKNLEEQQRIVQEIESRLSVADKMEEGISQSIQKAESLRQSILKKAFSGELV